MTYLFKRLSLLLLTLLLISVVTFVLTKILPGDVAIMILGTRSHPETLTALRQELGLNDPLVVQYGRWIGDLLQGDWGTSLRFKEPIAKLLGQKILASGVIVVLSLLIALSLAIPLGVVGAVRQNRWQDTVSSSTALLGISLPDFFWGMVLILLFSRWLGLLPSSGFVSPLENLWLSIKHALLPAIALGLSLMAHLTRMTRSAMLEVLSQDYIRVSRSKGLGERMVVYKHALRNAIAPVITVAGLQLGYLFGSIIVVESLFNYTGVGWLTYQALLNRDIPLIQATVFVIATVFMLSNLVVDLVYKVLDPRISFE
ncbi:MAG: ABC transporter permease [Trueperaceae bacterium]|nr:MAG: ABC transporter permease [Trueperaceae bacterium]